MLVVQHIEHLASGTSIRLHAGASLNVLNGLARLAADYAVDLADVVAPPYQQRLYFAALGAR